MTNTHDDGGPAWPSGKSETPGYENSLPYYEGMSLRDWFAGMALQGLCAGFSRNNDWPDTSEPDGYEVAAIHAWTMADAMIAARKEGGR